MQKSVALAVVLAVVLCTALLGSRSARAANPNLRGTVSPPRIADTTPPETTIDSGPPASGKDGNVTFAFSSSEPGGNQAFGADGLVATYPDVFVLSSGLMSDGRIVAGGYIRSPQGDQDVALIRMLPDGTPDPAFGTNGTVRHDAGTWIDGADSLAVEPGGDILAGEAGSVERFHADGSLDTAFGTGGAAPMVGGTVMDLALQPDGMIVGASAVIADPLPLSLSISVTRLHPDGSPDLTFDSDGTATFAVAGHSVMSDAVAIQDDGKIVVSGRGDGAVLVRFNSDGSPDTSFGSGGLAALGATAPLSRALDVAIQPDGRIVVAGDINSSPAQDFFLARFTAAGALDQSFGTGGWLTTDFGSADDRALSLVLQPDGRIVAGGLANGVPDTGDYGLVRYNPDGSLDQTFGSGGEATGQAPIGSIGSLSLQPDGKFVAAHYDAVARFRRDGSPDVGSDFDCKLTSPWGATSWWTACDAGSFQRALSDGTYAFQVRAVDAVGNVDPTPATSTFTIDNVAPWASITSGPTGRVGSTDATLGFRTDEPATFVCWLDAESLAPCTSPVSYSGLSDGPHLFTVVPTDLAGNEGGQTARSWVVDTRPKPDVVVASLGPDGQTVGEGIFSADGSGQTLKVSVHAGARTRLTVTLENDARISDSLLANADVVGRGWDVSYHSGGVDITGMMMGAGFATPSMPARSGVAVKVVIRASAASPRHVHLVVSATSQADPTVSDAVKVSVRELR